jgi:hypothetical protein
MALIIYLIAHIACLAITAAIMHVALAGYGNDMAAFYLCRVRRGVPPAPGQYGRWLARACLFLLFFPYRFIILVAIEFFKK